VKKLQRNRTQAGFTLIEVILSIGIFAVIGVGLTQGIHIAESTQHSVSDEGNQNRKVRDGVELLREELKTCQEASIQVQVDGNGNDVLTFQVPVDSMGGVGWGVYDRKLGPTAVEWNRVGWSLCYRVQADNQGNSSALIRQILNGAGDVQREAQIVGHLPELVAGAPRGFAIEQTGDVWEVSLTTLNAEGKSPRTETFQIQARN
jgi:prepilin-type N-terminal cleavage/methylation domain-containing protein